MLIDRNNIHRIAISRKHIVQVNIAYTEIGDTHYEIYGSYSGNGGGGFFYSNFEGEFSVSDDFFDFEIESKNSDAVTIFHEIEKARLSFEKYDDAGNLETWSGEGKQFLENGKSLGDLTEAYSELASEDLIIDLQDLWNLSFYID